MKKSLLVGSALIVAFVLLSAVLVYGGPDKIKVNTGTLTGLIGIKGVGPMMGGTVFFFNAASGPPPSVTRYWRLPTYSFRVDDNARFTAVLPAGRYYMCAIERLSGASLGPPQDGDYYFIHKDKKGEPSILNVLKNKKVDIGYLLKAEPFRRTILAEKDITSIQGMIRNEKGAPVKDIIVLAFSKPGMSGRPLFVSEKSDQGGRYELRLQGGGKYYLQARVNYVGPPSADELMGVYKSRKAVPVKTADKQEGIDITVRSSGIPASAPGPVSAPKASKKAAP